MVGTVEIPFLLKAADSIFGWFGLLRKEQKERQELERRAIRGLYVALNETLTYFRRIEHPEFAGPDNKAEFERNIRTEDGLSRLWMEAAVELRDVNADLSQRCFMKGVYWTDRDNWDDEKVREANIKLEELLKDARALLGGGV
jgi:hypothetical protein